MGIIVAHAVWLRPSLVLIALAPVPCCAALRPSGHSASHGCRSRRCGAAGGVVRRDGATSGPRSRGGCAVRRSVAYRGSTVVDTGPVRDGTVQNVDEPSKDGPSQRIDLRVSSMEVVTDSDDALAPAPGGVQLTVRWPEGTRASPVRSPSAVASGFAFSSACCRRRSIAIPAHGAVRIICSIRELHPRPQ